MTGDLHTRWARLFAAGLASSGVRRVVVSPGSRSTPLALAVARDPALTVHVVIDERAAAFFALGAARMEGAPVALLATSGSAGAHYLPAVVEAARSRVPLVLITADRPWELAHAEASQTLDQARLFGEHVRLCLELGVPELAALAAVPRIAAQAVLGSRWPTPGPVHVNARFRKPLEPTGAPLPDAVTRAVERLEVRGAPRLVVPSVVVDAAAIEALREIVAGARRGVLLAGPHVGAPGESLDAGAARLGAAMNRFAVMTGFAVVAELTSQVAGQGGTRAIGPAELVLGSRAARGALDPDVVISVGAPPVASGAVALFEERPAARHVVIAAAGLPDPSGSVTDVLVGDAAGLLDAVASRLEAPRVDPAWVETTGALGRAASHASARASEGAPGLEVGVVRRVVRALGARGVLVLGNSLAVRDADAFAGPLPEGMVVVHQRGLAGIDGLVAGAAGVRAVTASSRPVALVLGDVSAQHDVGGLALAVTVDAPLVIVVVDNDGGRIFDALPIARAPGLEREREQLFLTRPTPGLFDGAAAGAGLPVSEVRDAAALDEALARALTRPGASIVRLVVDPAVGVAARAAARADVEARLGAGGEVARA